MLECPFPEDFQVEEVEEAPQETSTKSSAEGRRKDGGGDAQVGVDESATETTITLQLEAVGEASAGAPAEAPGETREEPAAPEPPKPARRLAQSVKVRAASLGWIARCGYCTAYHRRLSICSFELQVVLV